MENFKFYSDRTPLTPEEIQAHKNFDKVLQQFKNVPKQFYQTGWFKAGLATVTVVATGLTIFFATGPNKNENSDKIAKAVTHQSPYADESPCVKSPAPQLDVPQMNFTVNTQRDTVLRYETGSVILYKANSLKDEKGNVVTGTVVFHYREFHNPLEVFASGIPMKYDSAGSDYHLKSAGMIELTAEQNGKPVFIIPEKAIDVQMKSAQLEGQFNVYYLDTNNRNWTFEGVDNTISSAGHNKSDDHSTVSATVKKQTTELAKQKVDEAKIKKEMAGLVPQRPRQATPGSFTFTLDVLESEFPELFVYGKTKFEVIDKDKSFNNQMYSAEWEDISLREVKKGEEYKITLTRGNISKSFNAVPVVDGKDLKLAMEVYGKKYKEYEEKLAARIKEDKAKIEAAKKDIANWEREANEKHRLRIQDFTASNLPNDQVLARFGANNSTASLVTRAFTVSKFGVWNCDKAEVLPKGPKVVASFVDESGSPLPLTSAVLCEKGQNMMYTFEPSEFKKFQFNPKQKNIVWGMLPDGKLAYGLEETFAAENIKGKQMQFRMTVVHDKISTLKQVKELFGI